MTTSVDDEGREARGRGSCAECGTAAAGAQRYCLSCGARKGPLPPAIAERLAPMLRRRRRTGTGPGPKPAAAEAGPPAGVGAAAEPPRATGPSSFMPSPRVAAVAVLGMLGLGVLLGSATSQIAQSAGLSSIILEVAPPPPEEEPVPKTASDEPSPEPQAAPPAPVSSSSVPYFPAPVEEPAPEPPPEPTPPPEFFEEEAGLPEVKHVFLIVLGENGFEESFGATSTAPYLSQALPAEGELLTNYYALAGGNLGNQIAMVSGQGPTLEIAADCPTYTDIVPATVAAVDGQVEGAGCVYPAATQTVPGQLTAAGLRWKAYVEDIGNGALTGQPATCRHPPLGAPDPSQVPLPGDAYVTWRNPFVYFHSLVDKPECAETDVGLDRLAPDLKKKVTKKTPALSYIVPNACHDGGEAPCEPGQPAGPLAGEEFLKTVVPQIQASAAYKEGGLIAITSTQAPQTGEKADPSGCCVAPVYPNLPPAPEAAPGPGGVRPSGGGGRVGMLLLSPFVKPGSVNESGYFNHYTLLLTIEELFGLEKLGYANEAALAPFDESVFNAGEEEESTPAPK